MIENVKPIKRIPKANIKFDLEKDKRNRSRKKKSYKPNFFLKIDKKFPIDYPESQDLEEFLNIKDKKMIKRVYKKKIENRQNFYKKLELFDRTREKILNEAGETRKNLIRDWAVSDKVLKNLVNEKNRVKEQLGEDDFEGDVSGYLEKTLWRRIKDKWLNNRNRANYDQLKDKMEEIRILQTEVNKIQEYVAEEKSRKRMKVKMAKNNLNSDNTRKGGRRRNRYGTVKSRFMSTASVGSRTVDLNFGIKNMVNREKLAKLKSRILIKSGRNLESFDNLELDIFLSAYSENLDAFETKNYKKSENKAKKLRNKINLIYLKFGLTHSYKKLLNKKLKNEKSKSKIMDAEVKVTDEKGEISTKIEHSLQPELSEFTHETQLKDVEDFFLDSKIVQNLEPSLLTVPIILKDKIVRGEVKVRNLSENRKFLIENVIDDELYDTLEDENLIKKKRKKLMKLISKDELRNIEKRYIEYQNDFTSMNNNFLSNTTDLNSMLKKSINIGNKNILLKKRVKGKNGKRFKLNDKTKLRNKTIYEKHQRGSAEDEIMGNARKKRPKTTFINYRKTTNVPVDYIRKEIRSKSVQHHRPSSKHSSILYLRNRDLEYIKNNPEHTYYQTVNKFQNRFNKKLGVRRPQSEPVKKKSELFEKKEKVSKFINKINKLQVSILRTKKSISLKKKRFNKSLGNVNNLNRKVDSRINKQIKNSIRENNEKMSNNPRVGVIKRAAIKNSSAFSFFKKRRR